MSPKKRKVIDIDLDTFVRVEILLNAKLYGGKPNGKAVLGKILGKRVDLRAEAKQIQNLINDILPEIEAMSFDEISNELSRLAPELESEHKKEKHKKSEIRKEAKKDLPPLINAIDGKVIVRYAPDPSKYPHLGQGLNYLVNRLYADKYHGKVILRFDDTNPAIVAKEYYDSIKEGLLWLGATWDEEVIASSYLAEFYKVCETWLNEGYLYICTCKGAILSKNREKSITCDHRTQTINENIDLFHDMLNNKFKSGEVTVRLMADMSSNNFVMRDPIMFRIVKDKHPLLDKFYPVFPTYDFESAYLEYKYKITHVIRSGEFGTMRKELQSYLISKFGGKVPEFVSFGRYNIQGSPTKGRVIRELVQNGVVEGWDDIRLITLAALKKRGIHPETARLLLQDAGITPSNTQISWKTLEAKSKELLEPIAKRFFFVKDPIVLEIKGSKDETIELMIHPNHPEYGKRKFYITGKFYISRDDAKNFKIDEKIRLKDYCNIKIISRSNKKVVASFESKELGTIKKKIHWITEEYIPGELKVPDLLIKEKGKINENSMEIVKGYFESSITISSPDDVIQLERFGYAKIKVENDYITGHIVHKHW